MAWRPDRQVIRGEIDNRTRGRVRGRIWMVGLERPVELELEGNPWRDLAGQVLRFVNPAPEPGDLGGFFQQQDGVVGDITASRRVKVPLVSLEEMLRLARAGQDFPWHWGNALYLEWFSRHNGRVVIEATDYQLEMAGEAAWAMTEAGELEQRVANQQALESFVDRMAEVVAAADDPSLDEEHDQPTSVEEAEADAEDARMEQLLDRVTARIEREGLDESGGNFDRIYLEERARLMAERGESEPELTPEQEREQERRVEELNAIAEEALADEEGFQRFLERKRHPLSERATELAMKIGREIKAAGWLAADAPQEHPLRELIDGVRMASAKLAGATGMGLRGEWPPDRLVAGSVLVRLKKARAAVHDALRGLNAAEEGRLADPGWIKSSRQEVEVLLAAVRQMIEEVRGVLE